MHRYILRLSCPDRRGIVAAVGSFLLEHRCNIVESAQFGDQAQRFFMRVCFDSEQAQPAEALQAAFAPIGEKFSMQWDFYDLARKQRVVLMVSRFGHCLNDLLYRYRIGALPIEIPAIVSNHRDFYRLSAANDIPFHYLPVSPENKQRQEQQLLEIVGDARRRPGRAGSIHADSVAGVVPAARGARHQHPSLVPAELSGREAASSRRTIAASS